MKSLKSIETFEAKIYVGLREGYDGPYQLPND